MRTIEEIKRDMNLAEGCMHNRHSCDNDCINCLYLNYNKNINRLREENYQFYNSEERKEKAVKDISADRLEEICNAELDGRCVVLPCKIGDTVYVLTTDSPTGIEETKIYQIHSRVTNNRVFHKILCKCVYDAWENAHWEFAEKDFDKTVFLTKEAAKKALKGGAKL